MITSSVFRQLADVLLLGRQGEPVLPSDIETAVEGVEDFCLDMEERLDEQKSLIVALEERLEAQADRLERRIDRQVSR